MRTAFLLMLLVGLGCSVQSAPRVEKELAHDQPRKRPHAEKAESLRALLPHITRLNLTTGDLWTISLDPDGRQELFFGAGEPYYTTLPPDTLDLDQVLRVLDEEGEPEPDGRLEEHDQWVKVTVHFFSTAPGLDGDKTFRRLWMPPSPEAVDWYRTARAATDDEDVAEVWAKQPPAIAVQASDRGPSTRSSEEE